MEEALWRSGSRLKLCFVLNWMRSFPEGGPEGLISSAQASEVRLSSVYRKMARMGNEDAGIVKEVRLSDENRGGALSSASVCLECRSCLLFGGLDISCMQLLRSQMTRRGWVHVRGLSHCRSAIAHCQKTGLGTEDCLQFMSIGIVTPDDHIRSATSSSILWFQKAVRVRVGQSLCAFNFISQGSHHNVTSHCVRLLAEGPPKPTATPLRSHDR